MTHGGGMTRTQTITKTRQELLQLPAKLKKSHNVVKVTKDGEAVLSIMPWDLFESIMETLEVLGDKEMMEALQESAEDIRAGRVMSWESVEKELDL